MSKAKMMGVIGCGAILTAAAITGCSSSSSPTGTGTGTGTGTNTHTAVVTPTHTFKPTHPPTVVPPPLTPTRTVVPPPLTPTAARPS